jgi:hypothetical protein
VNIKGDKKLYGVRILVFVAAADRSTQSATHPCSSVDDNAVQYRAINRAGLELVFKY